MKTKLHFIFRALLFFSVIPRAFPIEILYSIEPEMRVENTGAVNANWIINPDGNSGY